MITVYINLKLSISNKLFLQTKIVIAIIIFEMFNIFNNSHFYIPNILDNFFTSDLLRMI
jgi:hypothetical protein